MNVHTVRESEVFKLNHSKSHIPKFHSHIIVIFKKKLNKIKKKHCAETSNNAFDVKWV